MGLMTELRPYTAEDVAFVRESVFGPQTDRLQWFGFSALRL